MTTKAKKRKPMVADADSEDHAKLRQMLKDHRPTTYGELRRKHGLSPVFLETQLQRYPEIFEGPVEPRSGRPQIRLREGELESREDILKRRALLKKVKQAGATGVRLLKLYMNSSIPSKEVQRLLESEPEITVQRKGKSDVLYKWTGGPELSGDSGGSQQSRIQASPVPAEPLPEPVGELDAELELVRNKLIVLCGKTHRHLSWLSNFLDPVQVHHVLLRWPEEFESEVVNLGNPDLIIRNKCAVDGAPQTVVAQVANEPAEPLETVIPAHTLEESRWKPSSPGMGSRRNGRAAIRGDRVLR